MTYPESDYVLVCTIFDQVIHAEIVDIVLHETKLMIVVAGSGLKLVKGLRNCFGKTVSRVSGTVALELEEER